MGSGEREVGVGSGGDEGEITPNSKRTDAINRVSPNSKRTDAINRVSPIY
ncbi:MAG: hypothetical protein V7L04_07125 [Nostoc sp.]